MSLQTRLSALITAVGADVKALTTSINNEATNRASADTVLFGRPWFVKEWYGAIGSAAGAASYMLGDGAFAVAVPALAGARPPSVWEYDATEWVVSGKQVEFAIKVTAARNAVAPGGQWIWTPQAITAEGGAGGAGVIGYTPAAALKTGPRITQSVFSGVSINVMSAWFTPAAAGWVSNDILAMMVNLNTATAANSYTTFGVRLFAHWV